MSNFIRNLNNVKFKINKFKQEEIERLFASNGEKFVISESEDLDPDNECLNLEINYLDANNYSIKYRGVEFSVLYTDVFVYKGIDNVGKFDIKLFIENYSAQEIKIKTINNNIIVVWDHDKINKNIIKKLKSEILNSVEVINKTIFVADGEFFEINNESIILLEDDYIDIYDYIKNN